MKTKSAFLVAFSILTISFSSLHAVGVSPARPAAWPTPTPTPAPRPRVAPTSTTTPAATPNPTVTVTPTPGLPSTQTLDELQTRIRTRVFAPEVRRGRIGIKIASLASGKVVFENEPDKYYMPASNMKNFTIATAFEKLGPDYKFITSVYAGAMPDASGTVRGDLRIFGRGDVSISTAFFGTSVDDPETYYKGLDRLADRIAAAGVKRVEGGIVGDESYFKGFAIPPTWEWDDLQYYYGAEISALPVNDNAVDIRVTPGTAGGPCIVRISPPNSLYQINNTCTTGGSKRELSVNKRIDRNVLDISGTVPAEDKGYSSSISITRPADLFVALLKTRLEKRGIVVTGTTRTESSPAAAASTPVEITKLESVPFREIAAKTMKPSQNMFTETILWTLGEQVGRNGGGNPSGESSQLGLNVVKSFLTSIGIPADAVVQYDGCGMSRHDQITPSAVVALYTYMAKQSPNAQAWRDSLTIGGVDGTLANRFKGTAAAGNMRGKTGTIDQVSALSGYIKTAAGEELVVSFLVNGVPEPRQRTSLIDEIVVNLANFTGRIDQ